MRQHLKKTKKISTGGGDIASKEGEEIEIASFDNNKKTASDRQPRTRRRQETRPTDGDSFGTLHATRRKHENHAETKTTSRQFRGRGDVSFVPFVVVVVVCDLEVPKL